MLCGLEESPRRGSKRLFIEIRFEWFLDRCKEKKKKKEENVVTRNSGIASKEVANNVRAVFARSIGLPRIGQWRNRERKGRERKGEEKSVGERSRHRVSSIKSGQGKLARWIVSIDVSSAKRVPATGYFYRNSRRM